jgi:hypothetical protein
VGLTARVSVKMDRRKKLIVFVVAGLIAAFVLIILLLFISLLPGLKALR